MEEGRWTRDSLVRWNTRAAILRKWDGDWNEIDESDPQDEKDDEQRISTEHGITIDRSVEFENAFDSIRFYDDGDSNEIDETDLQYEKHNDPIIVTNPGIISSFQILKQ
jgi:hypothetical protein